MPADTICQLSNTYCSVHAKMQKCKRRFCVPPIARALKMCLIENTQYIVTCRYKQPILPTLTTAWSAVWICQYRVKWSGRLLDVQLGPDLLTHFRTGPAFNRTIFNCHSPEHCMGRGHNFCCFTPHAPKVDASPGWVPHCTPCSELLVVITDERIPRHGMHASPASSQLCPNIRTGASWELPFLGRLPFFTIHVAEVLQS